MDEDGGAEDVGGHQIWRGLDAMKLKAEEAAEGFDDEGFGDAGYAFEEDVALAEQGDESFVDDVGLAGDDAGELGAGVVEQLAGGVEGSFGFRSDGRSELVCVFGHSGMVSGAANSCGALVAG